MHWHAHLVGKAACTKAAEYPKEMCTELLKVVAVIKKGREWCQLGGMEREDMCEEDTTGEGIIDDGYHDFIDQGLVKCVIGEHLETAQGGTACAEGPGYMRCIED